MDDGEFSRVEWRVFVSCVEISQNCCASDGMIMTMMGQPAAAKLPNGRFAVWFGV